MEGCIGTPHNGKPPKGRIQMSSQSPIARTLLTIVAAFAVSAVAITAAVGPAQANANPLQVRVYA